MSASYPRRPPRAISPGVLVLAGVALLTLAWCWTNAPFFAPDEPQHFVRAVGIGEGHLIGAPIHGLAPTVGLSPTAERWVTQTARAVHVPRGLDPTPFGCEGGGSDASAACTSSLPRSPPTATVTDVGTYQPLPYLLPALVTAHSSSAASADRYARLVSALICLVLLAAAVRTFVGRTAGGAVRLAGLVLALTPMVIATMAQLGGSGLEIAGGIAFAAALLGLTRAHARNDPAPPVGTLALAAVAGTLLALSRSTGPAWIVIDVLVLAAAAPRSIAWAFRQRRIATPLSAGLVTAAVATNRIWEARYGASVPSPSSALPPLAVLRHGAHESVELAHEAVGVFGYLQVSTPGPAWWAWAAVVVAFVGAALWLGARRQRALLIGACGACVVIPAAIAWYVLSGTGFGLQARHVLPFVCALPLLAAEIASRRATSVGRWSSSLMLAAAIVVPIAQLAAWWVNAHRVAVGINGPVWFVSRARWSPPGGWWLGLAVVLIACVLVAAGLGSAAYRERRASLTD